MIPFILHARVPEPEAKGVTLVSEAIKDENNLRAYRAYMAQMEYSRPFTIAPEHAKRALGNLAARLQSNVGRRRFPRPGK